MLKNKGLSEVFKMRRLAVLTLIAAPMGFINAAELPVSSASASPVAEYERDIPSIPAATLSKTNDGRLTVASKTKASSAPKSSRDVTVEPDVNTIIPVSVGHPNRIVTPFNQIEVRTTSNASFEPDGNSLYVTSNALDRPVVAYISDKSNPGLVMSLTFLPAAMPPVTVNVDFDEDVVAKSFFSRPNPKAKAWEESQPYLDTIRDLMRDVAMQNIPQGYTVSNTPNLSGFAGCYQSGLAFNFQQGQEIKGSRLLVNVGVVKNISDQVIEFIEPACAGPNVGSDVKAVATWPNPLLMPGQKSEVYVVRGISDPVKTKLNSRKSLLQE